MLSTGRIYGCIEVNMAFLFFGFVFLCPCSSVFNYPVGTGGSAQSDSQTTPFPGGSRGVNVSAREQKSSCRSKKGEKKEEAGI